MGTIWQSTDIDRFETQGEQHFTAQKPCLVTRYSPAIVVGVGNYLMPDDCFNIRRVTYRGWKLEVFSHRDLRLTLQSGTQPGRPRFFNYSNITRNNIQLWPIPIEPLPALTGIELYTSVNCIDSALVVEYYAISSVANSLPIYMRRRFLKCFVLWRCYLMEGKGQNLKAASYYSQKWMMMIERYGIQFDEMINAARSLTTDPFVKDMPIPPFARLPIDKFGISIEDEY